MKPNHEMPGPGRATAAGRDADEHSFLPELPWDADLDVEIIDGEFLPRRRRRDG